MKSFACKITIAPLFATLVSLAAACTQPGTSYEPAPLDGGESMTFLLNTATGPANATITFEPQGSGFLIKSSSPAFEPERVGPDLMKGRRAIAAYGLGMVWLPPSVRTVGSQVFLGNVTGESERSGRPVIVVSERNGQVLRFFDKSTGFLVYFEANDRRESGQLVRSTIPGL